MDAKDLNKAIKREHHVTPTLEEIMPQLNGAKYFSMQMQSVVIGMSL